MTNTISENISLRNNTIALTSSYAGRDLLQYIENFCDKNGISHKFVGESITVYPADYNQLNSKRFDLSDAYVELIAWSDTTTFEDDDEEYNVDDMYWVNVEDDINSFKDLDAVLLKIHNTKQVASAYYTEAEIFDQKLVREQNRIAYERKELKKVSKFQKKLEKYGMSEKQFLKLQELYEIQKNVSVS